MTTTGLYFHPYPRTGLDFSRHNFDSILKAFLPERHVETGTLTSGNFNLTKTETDFILSFLVPGFSREEIEISLEGRHLTVEGKKVSPSEDPGTQINKGFSILDFKKTVDVSSTLSLSDISASLANGILTIKIPVQKESQKKTIVIT